MENHTPKKKSFVKRHFWSKRVFKPTLRKIALLIVLVAGIVGLYFFILQDIPSTAKIGKTNYPQSTNIFDRNGTLLYSIYGQRNQIYVPQSKIPKDLQNATIAIEDKDFYNHGAVDVRGIARAVYFTLVKKQTQGGSTLTQQLVKNSLLTPERTLTRKAKEIILAYSVEALYSKDKILEMYLNQVSYGGTAWGVQAASYQYYDKPVSKLTLAESAYLAGLPESPSVLSPFGSNPERGKERQKLVLQRMREQGYITAEQEKKAAAEKLVFTPFRDKILAPHFVFYVKTKLEERYGKEKVAQGGMNVTTSLDLKTQEMAEQAVASEVAKLERNKVSNGAALITKPGTGEILAMVGSRNYFDTEIDGNQNVTISKRQPGSSIKPINYAAGLGNGYSAATVFVDSAKCFPSGDGKPYCPMNYDLKFHGVVNMRNSLANSYNIPAVKMLKMNGMDTMIATASAMGITTFTEPERYGLSLTLGGGEVYMTDMTEAFGVFANMGYRIPLQPILKVTDSEGEVIDEYKAPSRPMFGGKKVIPEGVAFIISNILADNGARSAAFGSNSVLKIGNYPVSVKTGTTNDYRDNWTIGYTPDYVVAVWVGNNDNTPMSGVVSGVTGAAPIWNDIMTELVKRKIPKAFPKPDSVVGRSVCNETAGTPPEGTQCSGRFEYFLTGQYKTGAKTERKKVFIDKTTQTLAKAGQTENVEEQEKTIITDALGDQYCVDCAHPENNPTPTPNP